MMNKLTIILGAGFSKAAGLPLTSDINDRFDRDNLGKILCSDSQEWFWADNRRNIEIRSYSRNYRIDPFSFFLNELVASYKEERSNKIDYEDLWGFLKYEIIAKNRLSELFKSAKYQAVQTYPEISENRLIMQVFEECAEGQVLEFFQYLVADMLYLTHKYDDARTDYQPFIDLLNHFDVVDLFSLNHDLLIENLAKDFDLLGFSDGFTVANSDVYYEDKPIPVFDFNEFERHRIRLYKLHGSIGTLSYIHCQTTRSLLTPIGGVSYYKPSTPCERHLAKRINPLSSEKKVQQAINIDVTPRFITGINKANLIKEDRMFAELYKHYLDVMNETEILFISGYSFRDQHINEAIESTSAELVVNHNISDEYPFKQPHSYVDSLAKARDMLIPQ